MDEGDMTWSRNFLLTWNDFQGIPRETPETREKSKRYQVRAVVQCHHQNNPLRHEIM